MTFWNDIILPAFQNMAQQVLGFLPNMIAALAIMLVGWLLAAGFDRLTYRMLSRLGFDRLTERIGIAPLLSNMGYTSEPSRLVGKLIYWSLLLISLLSAVETLHLTMVAATIQRLVAYIPNILSVILIVVFGALLARFLSSVVRGAAGQVGFEFAELLGKIVNVLVLIMMLVTAFSQLEIESTILEITFAAFVGAFSLAMAMTLGLGSRTIAQNILAGLYARRSFHIGQHLTVRDQGGKIIHIGTVNTVLLSDKHTTRTIPNTILIEEISECNDREDGDQSTG